MTIVNHVNKINLIPQLFHNSKLRFQWNLVASDSISVEPQFWHFLADIALCTDFLSEKLQIIMCNNSAQDQAGGVAAGQGADVGAQLGVDKVAARLRCKSRRSRRCSAQLCFHKTSLEVYNIQGWSCFHKAVFLWNHDVAQILLFEFDQFSQKHFQGHIPGLCSIGWEVGVTRDVLGGRSWLQSRGR